MEFPTFRFGQYAVVLAELATGIVLNLNGSYRLGSGQVLLVFDSLEEAEIYCSQKILDFPEIECNIYNHLKEHILTISRLTNARL